MTAPSGRLYPVGMRMARVFKLNSLGVPDATSDTTPYEGLVIEGAKAYELNIPDARRLAALGDDRIKMQDVLPRQEPASGTLRVSASDFDVHAVLTNTLKATVGEAVLVGHGTDQQGSEPTVALLCYQQGKQAGTGVRVYRSYMIPSTQAIITPSSMNDQYGEQSYSLLPSPVDHHIWGIAFAALVEGFTEAEIIEADTFGQPHIAAWKQAAGSKTEFNFHADRPAPSTAKIHAVATIASDGTVTDVTGTVTKATDGVTFSVAPANGTVVVCFYEY